MDRAASNDQGAMHLTCDGAPPLHHLPAPHSPAPAETGERRAKPERHSLFIRPAKLVSPQGEFVCVVRDVSQDGVGIRLFHDPPTGDLIELHTPNGSVHEVRQASHEGNNVGYRFAAPVDFANFLNESTNHPKRALRLGLFFPVNVRSLAGQSEGIIENLSQHGARFTCEGRYSIDQTLLVDCPEGDVRFGEVNAKVRWRQQSEYGVVFENTLSLEEFAKLAAQLQCPALLRPPGG